MGTVKTCKAVKKIDWLLLVRDLLGNRYYSQRDLAELCNVSQQCMSTWNLGLRKPGVFAKKMLYELACKEGIDLGKYETVSPKDAIAGYLGKDKGKEFIGLFELYRQMSRGTRGKFLKYAKTLVKPGRGK